MPDANAAANPDSAVATPAPTDLETEPAARSQQPDRGASPPAVRQTSQEPAKDSPIRAQAAEQQPFKPAAGGRLPPPLPKRTLPRPLTEPSPAAARIASPPAGAGAQLNSPSISPRSAQPEKQQPAQPEKQPNGYRRRTVYWLGAGLTLLSLFHLVPVLGHLDLGSAPAWSRIVLVITLVELAYVVWMVTVPDWSTVWTAMIVFALVAAVYGAALALTVMTPRTTSMLFDLDHQRDAARLWCVVATLLTSLMAYVAGTIGYRWR